MDVDDSKGAQLLVAALAADSYLGKYAIVKIFRGKLKKNEAVSIMRSAPERGLSVINDRLQRRPKTRSSVFTVDRVSSAKRQKDLFAL